MVAYKCFGLEVVIRVGPLEFFGFFYDHHQDVPSAKYPEAIYSTTSDMPHMPSCTHKSSISGLLGQPPLPKDNIYP